MLVPCFYLHIQGWREKSENALFFFSINVERIWNWIERFMMLAMLYHKSNTQMLTENVFSEPMSGSKKVINKAVEYMNTLWIYLSTSACHIFMCCVSAIKYNFYYHSCNRIHFNLVDNNFSFGEKWCIHHWRILHGALNVCLKAGTFICGI